MAASCVRRTLSVLFTNRALLQSLRIRSSKLGERNSGWLRFMTSTRFQKGTAGITAGGLTYGLFGFKFWSKKEDDDPLTEMYRAARLAHHRNEFEKADNLYHACLKLGEKMVKSEEVTPEKHLTSRTLAYDGLADIAMRTGRIEDAEKLFVETLKGCFQEGMAQDDNVVVDISLKLSSIYAMQGKKLEAEEGFKFCLNCQNPKVAELEKEWKEKSGKRGSQTQNPSDLLKELESDTAGLLGMALGSYGRYLLSEKRYDEALPMFQRAELIARNTLGENSDQYIVVLNDLATLHIIAKNFDEAENILKDGIKITEKGKLHEGPMLHCNLGAVYLRRGQVQEALRVCQKGLDCAKQVDHKLAFQMASACLKKGESVLKQKIADAIK